jgi:hypothetical protein
MASAGPEAATYSLREYDYTWRGKTYPSLMRIYLEECDPTEYRFANLHLCDWAQWESLCAADWFRPHVERWRRELALKIRAAALAGMIAEAAGTGKEAQSARKYLLDGKWESPPELRPSKGRPSKQDIKTAAHEIANETSMVSEAYARLIQPKSLVATTAAELDDPSLTNVQ